MLDCNTNLLVSVSSSRLQSPLELVRFERFRCSGFRLSGKLLAHAHIQALVNFECEGLDMSIKIHVSHIHLYVSLSCQSVLFLKSRFCVLKAGL